MLQQLMTSKNIGGVILLIAIIVAFMYVSKGDVIPKLSSSVPEGASTFENVEQPESVSAPEPVAVQDNNDDTLSSIDLLPAQDKNAIEFASIAPQVDGNLSDQNFLTAGHLQGELAMSKKNANYGLRSEPPNPQDLVSPWMNTSIIPDSLRRPLC